MDGEQLSRRLYKMPKKIYANRYSTDCLAGIFERRAEQNNVGLDDLPGYAGIRATWKELQAQHSHFQNDMERVNHVSGFDDEWRPSISSDCDRSIKNFDPGYDLNDIPGNRST